MNTKKLSLYLFIIIFVFFIISILSIFSAQSIISDIYSNLYIKQIMWYILGILFLFTITKFSNEKIYRYAEIIYIISIISLILVLFIGSEYNNTKGWIEIGNLSFQPSEFTKISIILLISKILSEFHFKAEKTFKKELKLIFKIFIIIFIPSLLVLIEPDTGAIISYFIIAIFMIFISGLRIRWFIILFLILGIFIASFLLIYFNNSDLFIKVFGSNFYYRIHRLIDWSNSSGMQLENSLIAIGSSGIFGYGFNNTPIYFPEPYTDFIFTIFASNFGFIGISLLFIIIILFDYLIISIALKSTKTIDKYLIAGILATFIYSQIQNIGMTVGVLPITGIPLQFISYGGSSIIVSFIMIGFLVNSNYGKNWY